MKYDLSNGEVSRKIDIKDGKVFKAQIDLPQSVRE